MKDEQRAELLQYLEVYLNELGSSETASAEPRSFDEQRIDALPEINKLISKFLQEKIGLEKFKQDHESLCREYDFWGFKGFSGQMQLNQFVNNLRGEDKESVLRSALGLPNSEQEAFDKIERLAAYIAEKRSKAENRQSYPRVASTKYVLTYFWEIQDHTTWPVFYSSSEKILERVGLLSAEASEGRSYLDFLRVTREIIQLYEKNAKTPSLQHPYWFVEHVLFEQFLSSKSPTGESRDTTCEPAVRSATKQKRHSTVVLQSSLEWLPPIVADLDELAFNRETEWSKRNSVRPEKALETKIRYAFSLMGYAATELGQGTGRQPDGYAISLHGGDGDYAIVYDAKAREDRFNVGTADREIYEYIKKKSEELKKIRINRVYFLIVSSAFDQTPTSQARVKDVFRRTRIPIVMMTASDLLFLVEEKLKETDLTHDRLEQLFLETGVLTRDKIVEILGLH